MSSLVAQISAKVTRLRVPFSVHLDLTWRCNEDCVHCYLDHGGTPEMDTAEVKNLLDQLAASGTFFLSLSGGEILLRPDILEIVEHARSLLFSLTLKTNGILLTAAHARRFASLGVSQVHISLYSHRPEVHEGITRVPGSFVRSLDAIRLLVSHGVKARITDVLIRQNLDDYPQVQALGAELGVETKIDATVGPSFDGDFSLCSLRIPFDGLQKVFRDPGVVDDIESFCAPPPPPDQQALDGYPCGAGHSACYISPSGDVMPCVQFPVVCGNLRHGRFAEIWSASPGFSGIRATRMHDLPVCRTCVNLSSCTRCPGLALMAGDVLGPSALDCEKAYARTGIPSPLAPAPECRR
ncbi:MAG: radical SAM protein [Bryobacteraceae bacterium]|jgi:radical SAM protein with 4Fe4S-binding SPASM domain